MKNLKSFSLTFVFFLYLIQTHFVFIFKLFAFLLLFLPSPSWSTPNFDKKFDEEFKDVIPILTSKMIEKGLSLPEFNNELPFWQQIGNSEQLFDIEGFYKRSNPIIMDQFKEKYFYYKLNSIRDIALLKALFIEKLSKDHRALTFDNNSDFFQLFVEHINEKDLNSNETPRGLPRGIGLALPV